MKLHDDDGTPYGAEDLFSQLGGRLRPAVALAQHIVDTNLDHLLATGLADSILIFADDFEEAREAAADLSLGRTGPTRKEVAR